MSDTQRAILTALYAAVSAALVLPLSETTRRQAIALARCLARDLDLPLPLTGL